MLKNRIVFLVAVVLIAAVSYFGSQTGATTAVPIPAEINLWVAGVVLAAVTAGFAYLFQYLGIDLRDFSTPIAGTLSTWLLTELQGLVNTIPEAYNPYTSIAFKIIVVILSGMGTLYVIARARGGDVKSLL